MEQICGICSYKSGEDHRGGSLEGETYKKMLESEEKGSTIAGWLKELTKNTVRPLEPLQKVDTNNIDRVLDAFSQYSRQSVWKQAYSDLQAVT